MSLRTTVVLPDWIFGGDPSGFASSAALHARRDLTSGRAWQMETIERYERRRPDLIRSSILAEPQIDDLDKLGDLPSGSLDPGSFPGMDRKASSLLQGAEGDIVKLLSAVRILTTTTATDALPSRVRQLLAHLANLQDDQGFRHFPEVGMVRVVPHPSLGYRLALPRVLLRADESPLRPPTSGASKQPSFRTASDLLQGSTIFDLYMDPLLLSYSPRLWAIPAPRGNQTLLYILGRFLDGYYGNPVEPLQIFSPPSDMRVEGLPPQVSLGTMTKATMWWADRLNELFGVVSDIALFQRADGRYSPNWHLHYILSIEQTFRHVQSILTQARDGHARRVLLFGFFDTFMRLRGGDLVGWCSLSRALKSLDRVRATLPVGLVDFMIEPARRGVTALKQMQDGFFLGVSLDRSSMQVPYRHGGQQAVGLDKAVALYLQVLRDATHGFGGKPGSDTARDDALLARHTGTIPTDLALLPYLYLLEMLSDVTSLRSSLERVKRRAD